MAVDNNDIKISAQEKQAIKDNDPTNIPIDATEQGWTGDQVRAKLAESITGNEGSVLSELEEKTGLIADKFDEIDTIVNANDAQLETNTSDIADIKDGKLNRDGTQPMTGNLNMDTHNIVTEAGVNATTFDNGDNTTDAIVFNNLVALFDLDTVFQEDPTVPTKQPNETFLQYYTRLLEIKFASIQSTEELALSLLRRSGVDPMTGDLDMNSNAIKNVGSITDLETEIGTKVPKTRKIGTIDLQNDITIAELKTEIGNATQTLDGLLDKDDKKTIDTLTDLLKADDENTIVDTLQEILNIFANYPEGTTIATALSNKVDKVSGKELSSNDFTTSLKTKLENLNSAAEENVQSNWDEDDTNSDAYILNKPSIYEQGTIDTLLAGKVDVGTLNSNIMLYPTSTYEVGGDFDGYAQMVTEFSDARYNDTEVIVYTTDDRTETGTSSITSTDPNNPNIVGLLVADAGIFTGDISNINTTTIGQVRHVSGNVNTFLRYKIFNSSDMTTPIATSEWVSDQQSDVFFEIFESGVINSASFTINDRIVIHYEAYHEGAQDPIVAIKFGGENPTRTLLPVPLSVVQNAQLIKYDNVTSQLQATDVQAAIDELKGDIPTNNNELTNGAGYITDYTVTQADVTTHQASLTIAQSQVTGLTTDLGNKANLVDGKIPLDELPFALDDVLQGYYDSATGEFYETNDPFETIIPAAQDKLYIDIPSNSLYRYDGSSYLAVIEVADIVNLGDIPDVDLAGLQDNYMLKYDNANSKWVVVNHTLGELNNVVLSSASDGEFLRFNGTNWVNDEVPIPDITTEYAAGVVETNNDANLNFWRGTQAEFDALTFEVLLFANEVYPNGTIDVDISPYTFDEIKNNFKIVYAQANPDIIALDNGIYDANFQEDTNAPQGSVSVITINPIDGDHRGLYLTDIGNNQMRITGTGVGSGPLWNIYYAGQPDPTIEYLITDATLAPESINDLGDVSVDSPSDQQVLYWNNSTSKWEAKTINKTTLGLELVQNYPIATETQAKDGLLNDKYMTPLRTKENVNTNYSSGVIETNTNTNTKFWTGTQTEYDNLASYDNDTLYIITG